MNEFLSKVYEWLNEPRNRSIEDYHYSCRKVMGTTDFRRIIHGFLKTRYLQMYGRSIPKWMLTKATTYYINEM